MDIGLTEAALILIAGWILFSVIISLTGGWFFLHRRNPLPNDIGNVLKSYRWKSLGLNYFASYRGCVNMNLTDRGLGLKTSLFVPLLHKPLFVRWRDIKNLRFQKGVFNTKRVTFKVGRHRLVIGGKVAEMINDAYHKYR